MLRASAAIERAGFPTVSLVSTGFLKQAEVVARGLGIDDLKIAHYPGTPMVDSSEELRTKVERDLLPQIIEGLTSARTDERKHEAVGEPAPRDIVVRGTLEEINDKFYSEMWTDGMPVFPPTIAHVERFLRHTDRAPDEVIGVCPPDNREATVWNIAVTGVMAGCRPEYMPLLIAVVEAVTDPEFRVQDAGSTPGWEPLITVSGPIVNDLDFNSGASVMRVGRRANSTVGRFLRLILRNMAGFRFAPGAGDK
ncbi:MAG: UGSC family (seleno)protein, partial [Burkholderiales bacterium]